MESLEENIRHKIRSRSESQGRKNDEKPQKNKMSMVCIQKLTTVVIKLDNNIRKVYAKAAFLYDANDFFI